MRRSMKTGTRSVGDGAAKGEMSPMAALQTLFMSRLEFETSHPCVARMLCGELKQVGPTPAKTIAQSVIRDHSERLARELEAAKASGQVPRDTDLPAAARLFIGATQGLVLQSLLSGEIESIRANTPEILKILLRAVEPPPAIEA